MVTTQNDDLRGFPPRQQLDKFHRVVKAKLLFGRSTLIRGRDDQLFPGLDGVRFCAACMVMAVHFCYSSWVEKWSISHRIIGDGLAFPELYSGTWFGWIGVQIFFVLSGFVIAYSGERSTALEFAQNRILRLYPAAWVCATITALTLLFLGLMSPGELLRPWLASMTLYPVRPWIDPVYWTLGIEMSFYSIVFLLLLCRSFHLLEWAVLTIGFASSFFWIFGALFAD